MKTKAQKQAEKLATPKRSLSALRFPLDLESEGHGNIIRFKVNLPEGSKYIANGAYQKSIDPATGEARTSDFRSNDQRGSLARRYSKSYVRTTTVIDLFMPPQIQTSYASEWNAKELSGSGAFMDATSGIMNISDMEGAGNAWEAVKEVLPRALLNTATGALQSLTPINAQDARSFALREVSNPYMEVLFNGVQNRQFSFTFKMVPRNQQEQELVRKIVYEFKFHRAPEFISDNSNVYLKFPSEFDIEFIHKNGPNPWLYKISTCALTNIDVNHSPEGQYAAHKDGAPFSTEITLSFMEMSLLTKEDHEEGF